MAFDITIAGLHIYIHESVFNWLVLCLLFSIFFILAGKRIKKADPKVAPKGFLLLCEIVAGLGKGIISDNLQDRTKYYLPFFGTLIFMMAPSNLLGLIGLQPPTSNLSVNITLALMMFLLIHYTSIKENGLKAKLKGWCEPFFLFLPMNILGDLALPISLSLRLFGNMLAGSIIVGMVYSLLKGFMPFGAVGLAITPFLHAYFDIFSGLIQTYIFFTIASFFLSDSMASDED
ncbi:F0F1 ATP synthase subunit A [Amedibacillus sp. YH-ame10]